MNDDTKKLSEKTPQAVLNSLKKATDNYNELNFPKANFWMMNALIQLEIHQMPDPTPAKPAADTPPVAQVQVPPQVAVVERFDKAVKALAESLETIEELGVEYRMGRLGLMSMAVLPNPTDDREQEMIQRYMVSDKTGNVYDRKHGNWMQSRYADRLDLTTMMLKADVYVPGPVITQEDLQEEYLRGLEEGKNTPVKKINVPSHAPAPRRGESHEQYKLRTGWDEDTTSSTHSNTDYEALYREGLVKYNALEAERDALREALVEINGCGHLSAAEWWKEIRKILKRVGL